MQKDWTENAKVMPLQNNKYQFMVLCKWIKTGHADNPHVMSLY